MEKHRLPIGAVRGKRPFYSSRPPCSFRIHVCSKHAWGLFISHTDRCHSFGLFATHPFETRLSPSLLLYSAFHRCLGYTERAPFRLHQSASQAVGAAVSNITEDINHIPANTPATATVGSRDCHDITTTLPSFTVPPPLPLRGAPAIRHHRLHV